MYRYYVSFSFQSTSGLGVASLDVTARQLISTADDLAPVTSQITRQGYRQVKILAFSLYADPTRDTTSRNPRPHSDNRRNPNPHISPRPNPRGRRS
ncbi:hypothetical protein [Micromonospora aurantiaca (nom. illeg.)]|uniref:hypothetical protein n=1 Tax=Micromonospora aurantiaca (nom. illeg.) TaxID=47850 RepID=UPI003EBF7B9E